MESIERFKLNAIERDLCSEYALKWQQCKDKESLFSLSLIPQSIPYMATSSFRGWGLSVKDLKTDFADYINGKYIVNNLDGVKGATGSFYVDYDNDISDVNTVMHFMSCKDMKISIPKYRAISLYISNSSNVKIDIPVGFTCIYLYDNSTIDLGDIKSGATVVVYRYSNDAKVIYDLNNGICNIKNRTLDI